MSLSVFVDVLLTRASTPFREYARLACTCKKLHALLGDKVQAHKWATFQKEFLLQLDFVERFTAESETIVFPIRGHRILARVRRDWDFVKEVVTVTVTAETPWPARTAAETLWWRGWTFAYVYDPSKSPELNLDSINRRMVLAAGDHLIALGV